MPAVEPCAISQDSPAQQSALFVHPPQLGTQAPPVKHWKPPPSVGTQGGPSPPSGAQQSEDDAHALPGFTQPRPLHRGTPTLSGSHESVVSQLPAQQSHGCEHAIVLSLQTCPFGWQV